MENLEVIVTTIGLIIALWALHLQKREIIKNGEINSLIHLSSMLQQKINYHSKIIDDKKLLNKNWKGHADKINNDYRPLKHSIENKLFALMNQYEDLPSDRIRETLDFSNEEI